MAFSLYISKNDCLIYRFISIIFISITIICFTFNIRFLLIDRHRLNPLTLSLIINSLIITCSSLPYISIQSINCYPIESYFICSLEGFACLASGICVMYTMSLLAFVRYIRLFYNSSIIYRIIEHKNSFLIPFLCWFISFIWALPPFMNIEPGFMREGQGFGCGLNWIRSGIRSRVYIFLAFILIYFLPLFSLLYTNIHILIALRKLIYQRYPKISKTIETISVDMRHRLIDMFTSAEINRLKRLRIDRRFTQATMVTVLHYLIAWTPYASCGMIQMILSMRSIHYQLPSMLLTVSALIARLSIIGQSCIYFYTVRPTNRSISSRSTILK